MSNEKIPVGWREWVTLPEYGIDAIKAKIDTGAKTSALHAFYVEPYTKEGQSWVKFGIHPIQGDLDTVVECHAPVLDVRTVKDSGGHSEERYVIVTPVVMGATTFKTELTLTNRDTMRFRMLIGRSALNNRFMVDPVSSYLLGRKRAKSKDVEEEIDDEDSDAIEE